MCVVVGDENAYVFVFKFVNYCLNIFHGNGVDACKRFVEHYKPRIYGQTTGNFGASAFAARQIVAEVLAHFFESEFGDEAFEFVALLLLAHVGHLKHRADVVFDAHFAEYRCFLGEIAYAVASTFVYGQSG